MRLQASNWKERLFPWTKPEITPEQIRRARMYMWCAGAGVGRRPDPDGKIRIEDLKDDPGDGESF